MEKRINTEYHIIESLVSALVGLHSAEGGRIQEEAGTPLSVQEAQDMHAAYQLKYFTDIMPGGFFIYRADEEESLIYANEAMLRIFQCDTMEELRELTGNSFRGIVHPDDLEAVEASIREQIAQSQYDLDYVEYRIIRKDGMVRWLDDYGHFVHSESVGDVFYVFVGDATEKKERQMERLETWFSEKLKREQELQEKLDSYDKAMEVINREHLIRLEMIEGLSVDYESIFYVDLDRDQIKAYRVSRRFRELFAEPYAVRKFTGFDADYIAEWVCPEDRELVGKISDPAYLRKKLKCAKNRDFHLNYRVYEKQDIKYIQLRVVNVGSEDHIAQLVFGYRNIDEEMISEMQQQKLLKEALNEANLANNAKNLFLANMSHDIRTPMNAIVNFTELIKKHVWDHEKVMNYLNMISASSEQLLQLLNDVLEISRLESGAANRKEEECSLIDIVHQVQMEILPKAAEKNITLSLDISNLKHDHVCADKGKLGQILAYLTDNAVKYTGENGRVTIVVIEKEQRGAQDDHVIYQFAIEDNGIGISEEFMTNLFEPFEREKNTTLSGIYGTGLGLPITKKLVSIIGGTIEVSSTAGEGSRFVVTLPLRIQKTSGGLGEAEAVVPHFSTPKRILIVDDNEINLEIEYEVLKDAGFLVDTAEDGSVAVDKIKQSDPGDYHLILMDIQMPVMDGYRATRAIREMKNPALAGIPIIAVSANAFEEDRRKAMESGMNAHLAKPLDTLGLYKLIRKFLKEN
ncbi:MAG: response regulator [Blautia sp.]|nr:response regulator [Blautia sp.]MCM1201876.1 response regulator [Bacteroides fragilis]